MKWAFFSNADYKSLADEIIKDSFYADNSYGGKIAAERRCAELIVRFVLDLRVGSPMTLGEVQIKNQIKQLPHHSFLENAIMGLKPKGNESSHTYGIVAATEADYERTTESLMNMFAYIFIKYFDKYPFGSKNEVMSSFSLLPPIIRYKTLEYLYSIDSQNISVIDKLVLVIMKAKGDEKAKRWVDDHKSDLEKMKVFNDDAYNKIAENQGIEIAEAMKMFAPDNMYRSCMDKIEQLKNTLNDKKLYQTFEEAFPYYQEHGIIPDDGTDEVQEFNKMMEFLYLGRKSVGEKIEAPFLVLNIV